MKANEKAGNRAIKAVCLEDEGRSFDQLNPLRKAESSVLGRGPSNEEDEEKQGQNESWHTFKTP